MYNLTQYNMNTSRKDDDDSDDDTLMAMVMAATFNDNDGQSNEKTMATTTPSTTPRTASQNNNKIIAMLYFGGTVGIICGLTAPFVFTKTILPWMATPKYKVEAALRFCLQKRQQHHRRQQRQQMRHQKIIAETTVTADSIPTSSVSATTLTSSLEPLSSPSVSALASKSQRRRPVFVDLGSGDGEAVKQAAKLGFYAVGIELNWTMWFVSSVRRLLFFTTEERERSRILYGNMFDHSLGCDKNREDDEGNGDGNGNVEKADPTSRSTSSACSGLNADVVMIFGVTPLMPKISKKLQQECKLGTTVLSYRFGLPLFHPSIADSTGLLRGRVIYDRDEMRIYEKTGDGHANVLQ